MAHRDTTPPGRPMRALALLAVAALLLAPTAPAAAQPRPAADPPSSQDTRDERRLLRDRWYEEFRRADYPAAEASLRRLIQLDGDNFVHHYNLACVLAAQEKPEDALEALVQAVAAGFTDIGHLQSDPHLRPLRELPRFQALIDGWDMIQDARIDLRLDHMRQQYGPRYTIEKDERLRLGYVSAFEPVSFGRAKEEIAKLARWWEEEVVSELGGKATVVRAEGDDESVRSDPWVVVFLPTKEDYARWAAPRFGEGWQQVGGSYSDDRKELIAQDLGGTLRHEFWHVLHWRDMRRRGQMHPIWIMEGLCSLVEDVDTGPDGRMVPLPSSRTNIAKRRLRGGALLPWAVLFDREQRRFVTSSPLAHYAEARTVFLYLAHEDKLAAWYAAYVRSYDEDPTGAGAFVEVFGRPIEEIERRYRAWLRDLPEIPEEVPFGAATLPFTVVPAAGGQAEAGDGLQITTSPPIPRRARGQPEPERLRIRDIVTAIDGKPVRDIAELVRVLGEYGPGQEVEVSFRRGKRVGAAKATLVANRPPR